MTLIRATTAVAALLLIGSLAACGKDEIIGACEEPQAYPTLVPGKRIVVPEGLDPLDELKEMPIPKADTPPRPEGAGCLESTPSILTGGSRDQKEEASEE